MKHALKNLILRRLQYTAFLVAVLFPVTAADADSFISNGATIDYEVHGSGAPVFILHGGLASREDLRSLINHLAKSRRVIALDSRGHGLSTGNNLPISYALMADDVANLAKHLGLWGVTIVGQSDGGITALTVAMNNPMLVARLVLLGASFSHTAISDSSKNYLTTFKGSAAMDRTQFPGMYLDDYLRGGRKMQDYQRWFDKLAQLWTISPNFSKADLSRIKVPTLVINGDRNDIPLDHAVALYTALANAQLFVVPGAGHFLQHEKPLVLNRAISDFLKP
jgi:pimeloyl-ACP methyl ester carboxylesterase